MDLESIKRTLGTTAPSMDEGTAAGTAGTAGTASTAVDTEAVVAEYERVEVNLKGLQDQLREKNDEIQRLKQAVLISTGARVALGKLLGITK